MSNDFTRIFWLIGQAILHGQDPYSVHGNVYPPAANYFFAMFALLPVETSFLFWVLINILILLFVLYKQKQGVKSLIWFGYTPVIFIFASGQIDLIFLGLSLFLEKNGWISIIAAALITLKPQIAFVLLPWILINWFFKNRSQLIKWVLVTVVLHLLPLLIDSNIYYKWWASSSKLAGTYLQNSPGVFGLNSLGIPVFLLVPIGVIIFLLVFFLNRNGSIVTGLLALPIGTWYNLVLLIGIGHANWIVLSSWLAFGLAYLLHGSYPFIIIPLVTLYFVLKDNGRLRFLYL